MVYRRECSNCDRLIDFGGRESLEQLPENAIEFDGEVYCKSCVQKLVRFGSDNLRDEVEEIEEALGKVIYQLGLDIETDIETR